MGAALGFHAAVAWQLPLSARDLGFGAHWALSVANGKLPLGNLGKRSPEEDAKRILAERFARGDITSDEFLERSSILNWTPGAEPLPSKAGKKRR